MAEANNWSALETLTNHGILWLPSSSIIIWSPSLFFNEYLWEVKQSAIVVQERSQAGEKCGFIYAWAEYYLQQNTVGWQQQQQQQQQQQILLKIGK